MIAAIVAVRVTGDSVGGVVTCIGRIVPRGQFSLPATKGFKFGSGFLNFCFVLIVTTGKECLLSNTLKEGKGIKIVSFADLVGGFDQIEGAGNVGGAWQGRRNTHGMLSSDVVLFIKEVLVHLTGGALYAKVVSTNGVIFDDVIDNMVALMELDFIERIGAFNL